MTYKIEHGIPIPEHRTRKHRACYPWGNLLIGDSFFVPCDDPGKIAQRRASVLSSGRQWALLRQNKWRFTTEIIEGGVRIWRRADKE